MNLVRGVALIGLAGAFSGAGVAPDPLYSLAEKSGSRVAVVGLSGGSMSVLAPATLAPYVFPTPPVTPGVPLKVMPNKSPWGNAGPGFIPTEIHAHVELIPTKLPDTKIFWCNR